MVRQERPRRRDRRFSLISRSGRGEQVGDRQQVDHTDLPAALARDPRPMRVEAQAKALGAKTLAIPTAGNGSSASKVSR